MYSITAYEGSQPLVTSPPMGWALYCNCPVYLSVWMSGKMCLSVHPSTLTEYPRVKNDFGNRTKTNFCFDIGF